MVPICIPALIFGIVAGVLLTLIASAIRGSLMCDDGKHHAWSKWEKSPGGNFDVRTCQKCGWQKRV